MNVNNINICCLVDSGASKGTQFNLDIGDNLYIGGYSGTHSFPDVSNEAFEGCIKDVQLGSAVRDINDNQKALNVVPGNDKFFYTQALFLGYCIAY